MVITTSKRKMATKCQEEKMEMEILQMTRIQMMTMMAKTVMMMTLQMLMDTGCLEAALANNPIIKMTSCKPGAKLPTLHPKQFYWDGERARLRLYIQRWYDHLKSFQDYAALMFLQRCVPPNYQDLVLSHQRLVPCLQYLATYCANEEMYCKKALEEMKAAEPAKNFEEDKALLNIFDNKLVEIVGLIENITSISQQ